VRSLSRTGSSSAMLITLPIELFFLICCELDLPAGLMLRSVARRFRLHIDNTPWLWLGFFARTSWFPADIALADLLVVPPAGNRMSHVEFALKVYPRFRRVELACSCVGSCIRRDFFTIIPKLKAGAQKHELHQFELQTRQRLPFELRALWATDGGVPREQRLENVLSKIPIEEALSLWDWFQSYEGIYEERMVNGRLGGIGVNKAWIPYFTNTHWTEVWCISRYVQQHADGSQRVFWPRIKYFVDANRWEVASWDFAADYVRFAQDWLKHGCTTAIQQHQLECHPRNPPVRDS